MDQAYNGDQGREWINTSQRFSAYREARDRAAGFRGSLTWHRVGEADYLQRSYYDGSGRRRQKNEGRRDLRTETLKSDWETGRERANSRLAAIKTVLARQAAVNRALDLGRMPLLGARILRAFDEHGLVGKGIRVVGTNALFAYEAAAGRLIDAAVTTTEDIDFLMDSRRALRLVADDTILPETLIDVLRTVDRSFQKSRQTFRAVNRAGYLVDLIKPLRRPPWRPDRETVGAPDDDLRAASIAGLAWLESAPPFESMIIDERGMPLRMVAPDPRVFAAHKLWLSRQPDRQVAKRNRDAMQAQVVASLVRRQLLHLPYEAGELRMLPREVFDAARPLFEGGPDEDDPFA